MDIKRLQQLAGLRESTDAGGPSNNTKELRKKIMSVLTDFDPNLEPRLVKVSNPSTSWGKPNKELSVIIKQYGTDKWWWDTGLGKFNLPTFSDYVENKLGQDDHKMMAGEEDAMEKEYFNKVIAPFIEKNLLPKLEQAIGLKGTVKRKVAHGYGATGQFPGVVRIVFKTS